MLARDAVFDSDSRSLRLPDGTRVGLRAVRPHDAQLLEGYLQGLSVDSRRNRLFGAVSQVAPAVLARMVHLDGNGGIALLAFHGFRLIGEAMQLSGPDGARSEIALSVMDAWQRRGLGTLLLRELERRARGAGIGSLTGEVLRTNTAMKALAQHEGFLIRSRLADPLLIGIVKDLSRPSVPACAEGIPAVAPIAG